MKKFINFFFLSLCIIGQVMACIGCMDTSKHTKIKDGYDYKTLHYVECSCPCHKYRHLMRKGKCFKCRHYVKPDAVVFDMRFLYENPSNTFFGTRIMPYKYF